MTARDLARKLQHDVAGVQRDLALLVEQLSEGALIECDLCHDLKQGARTLVDHYMTVHELDEDDAISRAAA